MTRPADGPGGSPRSLTVAAATAGAAARAQAGPCRPRRRQLVIVTACEASESLRPQQAPSRYRCQYEARWHTQSMAESPYSASDRASGSQSLPV
jgi:hypothetical protein